MVWGKLGFWEWRAEGMSSSPLPNSTATSNVVSRRMYSFCQRMGNSWSLKMRRKSAIRFTSVCVCVCVCVFWWRDGAKQTNTLYLLKEPAYRLWQKNRYFWQWQHGPACRTATEGPQSKGHSAMDLRSEALSHCRGGIVRPAPALCQECYDWLVSEDQQTQPPCSNAILCYKSISTTTSSIMYSCYGYDIIRAQ